MASNSNSGKMKRASSSTVILQREPIVLEPGVYWEYACYSFTNFGNKFPNVFLIPDITMEERYARLIDEINNFAGNDSTYIEGQETAASSGVIICSIAGFVELSDHVKSEDELIRVYSLVGVVGHRLTEQMKVLKGLDDISVSIVSADGTRLHTPDLQVNNSDEMYEEIVTKYGLTTFVTWNQSLKELWDNSGSYFPDGTLRLKIKFSREISQSYLVLPESVKTMADTCLDLLNNGDMSDFTITTGTDIMEVFNVHQFILRYRSEFFRNLFSNDCVEVKEGKMSIPDVEPDTFRKMLEFMYGGKVEPENLEVELVEQLWHLIVEAGIYQISGLKDICLNYLAIHGGNEALAKFAILAEDHHASHEIRKRSSDFIAENFKVLREQPDFVKVLEKCNKLPLPPTGKASRPKSPAKVSKDAANVDELANLPIASRTRNKAPLSKYPK